MVEIEDRGEEQVERIIYHLYHKFQKRRLKRHFHEEKAFELLPKKLTEFRKLPEMLEKKSRVKV